MLVIFAVIIGGIIAGRLLSSWRLVFVSRMITVIIWLLLFLLGLEVGSDPAVVGGMATLGRTAFVIFACSVAGSICMSWLLWRCVRRGTASRPPAEGMPEQAGAVAAGIEAPQPRVTTSAGTGMPGPAVAVECPGQNAGRVAGEHVVSGADAALSMWGALRGSLVIVAFFVAGCLAGLSSALPFDVAGSRLSTYVLYALMFCVGITLGNDTTLAGRVRRLDPRLALLPVMTAVGMLAGAALSTLLLPPLTAGDTMAVGAGFGYYSLSSIFIADFRGAELGTVALLCNVMRELFTLLAAPLVARWFGPLADRRSHDFRYHPADHHAVRRETLCRGVGLPRLRARFQRPVPGDVLLHDVNSDTDALPERFCRCHGKKSPPQRAGMDGNKHGGTPWTFCGYLFM